MKKHIRNYLFLILVGGVLILLDQLTKNWIRSTLAMGDSVCLIDSLCEHVKLVHWYNTGVAFGLFQGNSTTLAIIASIVVIAIIFFYSQIPQNDWMLRLALTFEMGGAIGNLIDRIRIGHVTDFVAVGNFPVFNVADACINIGVAFMVLSIIIEEVDKRKHRNQELLPEAGGLESEIEIEVAENNILNEQDCTEPIAETPLADEEIKNTTESKVNE